MQRELGANMMLEVRYVGSKGTKLLEARAFNQGYDFNVRRHAGLHLRAIQPGLRRRRQSQRRAQRGRDGAGSAASGRAFGFANPSLGGMLDYNLANAGGAVIGFEARTPILGFNVPEAVLLGNTGRSLYNSVQFNLLKRMSDGLQFNLAYTYSRSKDTSSADPGQHGRRRQARRARMRASSCRATSAISTRTTRCRTSTGRTGSAAASSGICRAGRARTASGCRASCSCSPVCRTRSTRPSRSSATRRSTATSFEVPAGSIALGFGRPSLCGSLDELRQAGDDPTEAAFNKSVLCSPTTAAGGYPDNLGFGNLGRNVLRGFWQRRVDLSLAKSFRLGGARNFELRWDVFNVFNTVNYALPNNVIGGATTDFGKITDSVGGPRVMQFGARVRF